MSGEKPEARATEQLDQFKEQDSCLCVEIKAKVME